MWSQQLGFHSVEGVGSTLQQFARRDRTIGNRLFQEAHHLFPLSPLCAHRIHIITHEERLPVMAVQTAIAIMNLTASSVIAAKLAKSNGELDIISSCGWLPYVHPRGPGTGRTRTCRHP